jgi:hypothetical protein
VIDKMRGRLGHVAAVAGRADAAALAGEDLPDDTVVADYNAYIEKLPRSIGDFCG